jgi:diamine N-acetyltransferase
MLIGFRGAFIKSCGFLWKDCITMEFRKVDADNIWKIIKLSVKKEQEDFVATNTESVLEAYTMMESDYKTYPLGIYEGGKLVGFIMFGYGISEEEEEAPKISNHNYSIWRLMIDEKYQGQGLGKKAVETAITYFKTWPYGKAEYCWLSYEPENELARNLYHSLGFEESGEMCEDEIIAVLKL